MILESEFTTFFKLQVPEYSSYLKFISSIICRQYIHFPNYGCQLIGPNCREFAKEIAQTYRLMSLGAETQMSLCRTKESLYFQSFFFFLLCFTFGWI